MRNADLGLARLVLGLVGPGGDALQMRCFRDLGGGIRDYGLSEDEETALRSMDRQRVLGLVSRELETGLRRYWADVGNSARPTPLNGAFPRYFVDFLSELLFDSAPPVTKGASAEAAPAAGVAERILAMDRTTIAADVAFAMVEVDHIGDACWETLYPAEREGLRGPWIEYFSPSTIRRTDGPIVLHVEASGFVPDACLLAALVRRCIGVEAALHVACSEFRLIEAPVDPGWAGKGRSPADPSYVPIQVQLQVLNYVGNRHVIVTPAQATERIDSAPLSGRFRKAWPSIALTIEATFDGSKVPPGDYDIWLAQPDPRVPGRETCEKDLEQRIVIFGAPGPTPFLVV